MKVAVNSYRHLVVGQELDAIYSDFATYWRKLTQETQIRWVITVFVFSTQKDDYDDFYFYASTASLYDYSKTIEALLMISV